MEVTPMKKAKIVVLAALALMVVFCGGAVGDALGDENYNDNSNEYSDGPGVPPEDGMSREEPRTRNKDA